MAAQVAAQVATVAESVAVAGWPWSVTVAVAESEQSSGQSRQLASTFQGEKTGEIFKCQKK